MTKVTIQCPACGADNPPASVDSAECDACGAVWQPRRMWCERLQALASDAALYDDQPAVGVFRSARDQLRRQASSRRAWATRKALVNDGGGDG